MPDAQPSRMSPVHGDAFVHGLPNLARQLVGSIRANAMRARRIACEPAEAITEATVRASG
jgi:hypothetical protein